ncbi:MAG: ABC transporter permease [Gemmatimonas sp.]
MTNAISLLWRYFTAGSRAQLQYPGSALMLIVGQFGATIIDMIAIWALFDRFGAVDGWQFGDVAMFFGIVSISFAIADFTSRGFDVIGTELIKTGNLDRLLVRPRTLTLQLIGYDFRLSRMGRLLQGIIVVLIATRSLQFQWDFTAIAMTLWTIAGGVALFFGLMVVQGTISFWTTESLEAMNLLTYGGVQAAQFPLGIYERWFRNFLIFVVPIGCVAYFPVVAILGKPDPLGTPSWLLPFAPLAGFAFLALSFLGWRFGVAKYTSTGS